MEELFLEACAKINNPSEGAIVLPKTPAVNRGKTRKVPVPVLSPLQDEKENISEADVASQTSRRAASKVCLINFTLHRVKAMLTGQDLPLETIMMLVVLDSTCNLPYCMIIPCIRCSKCFL